MMRVLFLSCSLLVLAAGSASAEPVSAAQLAKAIPGNTIEGVLTNAGGFQYYFAPDGRLNASGKTAAWELRGAHLCLRFDPDPVKRPECYAVDITGDKVTLTSNGQVAAKGTLLAGNARGLQ